MKQLILLCTMLLFSFVCAISSKLEKQTNDKFLIHTQYKIIEHGYFKFIQLNNSIPIREITFSYSIDQKSNEFSVRLMENKKVGSKYSIKGYKFSKDWNIKERNPR